MSPKHSLVVRVYWITHRAPDVLSEYLLLYFFAEFVKVKLQQY